MFRYIRALYSRDPVIACTNRAAGRAPSAGTWFFFQDTTDGSTGCRGRQRRRHHRMLLVRPPNLPPAVAPPPVFRRAPPRGCGTTRCAAPWPHRRRLRPTPRRRCALVGPPAAQAGGGRGTPPLSLYPPRAPARRMGASETYVRYPLECRGPPPIQRVRTVRRSERRYGKQNKKKNGTDRLLYTCSYGEKNKREIDAGEKTQYTKEKQYTRPTTSLLLLRPARPCRPPLAWDQHAGGTTNPPRPRHLRQTVRPRPRRVARLAGGQSRSAG